LGESFVGQISFVLVLEIRQRPVANRIERVQPSDRLQLLFQIAEHESDQALGLPSLVAGFIACLKRRNRKGAGDGHSGKGAGGQHSEPSLASNGFALDKIVEAHSEHSCTQLQQPEAFTVAVFSQISAEGLGAFRRWAPPSVVADPQGRRQALLRLATGDIARERLSTDNRGEDTTVGPNPLERVDFGVRPA
jgi:hypothetical protein